MGSKSILGSVGGHIASLFNKKGKTAIVARAHLSSPIRFPGGPFQFKFHPPGSGAYEVYASGDLENWEPVLSGKSSGEPGDFVDSDASKFNCRFYRVLAETIWSSNLVGYVTVNVPPGYSMIANPLQAPSNSVGAILAGMPDGTTFNKFDTHMFKLTNNTVANAKWSRPDETLVPGEGAILFNPTSNFKTLNFVGEVMQGDLLMPIAAGFSVRSSQIPKPGRLEADLGFPMSKGDLVHLFDRDRQNYVIYEYDRQKWRSDPPVVNVGEAFWIGKTSPGNWVQRLLIQETHGL